MKIKTRLNYLLKDENALYYECSFSCDNAIFVSLENENFFITDSRYVSEAKEFTKNTVVIDGGRDLIKSTKELIINSKIKSLTIDPLEWNIDAYEKLSEIDLTFNKELNFSQKKRMIKSDAEIKTLKKAVELGEYAFYKFSQYLQSEGVGKSEKYLNFILKNILQDMGELDLSFNPIVAIDENSAKPHALPSSKELNKNSLILVDAGVKYNRYCSDRTRTSNMSLSIDFLQTQNFTDKGKQRIYDTVLKAHDKAIEAVRVGVKASDIDKAAREVIDKAGFAKEFLHSTGHGVGLDIHELPIISKTSDTIIEENMVFTIEPGIYLENGFGVRIEDMIVVQDGRAEVV